jgi:hypothetical protein
MTIALFTSTDRLDQFGATIFRLVWAEATVEMVSGLPGYEPVDPRYDYAGSCRPIPEGIYSVGDPVHETVADCDAAIGPDWIPLHPETDISGRDGFLIHRDWNYVSSPGTAGCPAPLKHSEMDVIVAAVAAGEFDRIKVDYGYGVV